MTDLAETIPDNLPFLHQVARVLWQKYNTQLTDLHIILPTRRACMYFRHYLLKETTKTILSPEIWSMDDFILNTTPLEILDSVKLLFRLFETYKKFDTDESHDLEKFAPLGTIILKDFDGIDKNLVDGDHLFDYLNEVKALERWRKELGQDELELDENSSITNYYEFWDFLRKTYTDFRKELLAQKMAYLGLAFRYASENLEEISEYHGIERVVFAGFNQLSASESAIIAQFDAQQKAELFWDADEFYLKNPLHEAGLYLRQNLKKIQKNATKYFTQNSITTHTKNIEIISVNDKVTQAKLTGDILKNSFQRIHENQQISKIRKEVNHTLVLLPDEAMLLPLLYSLPVDQENQKAIGFPLKDYINVTAGLTIDRTPLFYLIDNLFLMQENLRQEQNGEVYIYYKDVIRLLRHSFIQYSKNHKTDYEIIQNQIEKIQRENLIYIPLSELLKFGQKTSFYEVIFRSWNGQLSQALDAFFELVNVLSALFDNKHNVLENEYLYAFYTILVQLREELAPYEYKLNLRIFKHFLYEILRNKRVPFTGEPLAPIQIMGTIESRTLDFEQIIILSCNEGIFPKGKVLNSLIPLDLRRSFQLPTHLESDAMDAYTFYRLFHRAKQIYLIHSTVTEGVGSSEKSRFLTQVKAELGKLPNINITEKQVVMQLPENQIEHLEVEKEPMLLEKVETYLEKGITPSFVNMYIRSPLEFFQRKVLKLREPDDIEENMMVNTFGTIVHEFLDKRFQSYIGKEVSEAAIRHVYEDRKAVLEQIEALIKEFRGGMITEYGKNFILKYVAQYLINTFLELQIEKEAPYYLVNQENTLEHCLKIQLKDGRNCRVRLWGKADRIDIIDNQVIRVVDYKTGTYHPVDLRAKDMSDLFLNPDKAKIIQLLIYKYLLIKNLENKKIQNLPKNFNPSNIFLEHTEYIKSGFFFFRKLFDGFIEYKIKDEPKNTSEFMTYVEKFMTILVEDMLDTNKPFRQEASDFGFEIL